MPHVRFAALLSLVLPLQAGHALASDTPAVAQALAALPEYRPGPPVAGTLRIWGHGSPKHDFMGGLMDAWTRDLARYQPGIRIENHLYGTASAIGALSAGAATLAILGEEIHPDALTAFIKAKGYPPTSVDIATGSLRVRNADYAHVFFVRQGNPLQRLTLQQADAIFGAEHRGGPANIRTWGELGLGGDWAGRPIQPYGWKLDDDFALYFEGAVLGGSHRWNNAIRQFDHINRADGTIYDHGQQIVDALAKDPNGIAISSLLYARPEVRPLALAAKPGGPFYEPTEANLIAQRYPLTRILPAFYDQPPGQPADPCVREFLRLVLSREGQAEVARASGYLPLNAADVAMGNAKLGKEPIRVWGDDRLGAVVQRWEAGYRRLHPEAVFETKLAGTGSAMAGLYTHQADIALFGREPSAAETMAFEWVAHYRATAIPIAAGSLATPGHSPALAVIVPAANPLASLNLGQLAAILGDVRDPAFHPIRQWGELGLTGPWSDQPIHLYTVDASTGTGRFLTQAVLGGNREWSWSHLTELGSNGIQVASRGAAPTLSGMQDRPRANELDDRASGTADDVSSAMLAALRSDPNGLALVPVPAAPLSGARMISLAFHERDAPILPDWRTISDGTYPLSRTVYAVVDRAAGKPVSAAAAAFLRFALSPEGQADLQGDLIPLSNDRARRSLTALEGQPSSP